MSRIQILIGDVRARLADLADKSVHCAVTSPPYWGLRDYGVEGQLGLEKTPEEYVENMVEVFRGVKRVLRDDGTLWLNMGDCYAGPPKGSMKGQDKSGLTSTRTQESAPCGVHKRGTGLKPKDLVGMPWMLAKALQAPYYTGQIRDIQDRIWLAAMIDTEGCLFIHKRKVGQSNGQGYKRKHDSYGAGLEVSNTSEAIVQRCMAITGIGSICTQSPDQNPRRQQMLYRWNLRSNVCREVVREVYPHLVAKKHEARLLLSCPSSGEDAAAAHVSLKALHNGGTATIDWPPPDSMYEQGWYLRADIVWKKPNPMPESIRDRPTKSHEYMFLLTKRGRYYYDQEAVREPSQPFRPCGKNSRADNDRDPKHRTRKQDAIGKRTHKGFNERYAENPVNGRNLRSVWTIATQPFPDAHFATFPEALIIPCIKAGTSERGCCPECGAGWVRVVEKSGGTIGKGWHEHEGDSGAGQSQPKDFPSKSDYKRETTGWKPGCDHDATPVPCTVLDPFLGSGTTALVAARLGRDCIGIELSPDYTKIAQKRLDEVALMAQVEVT